jgi:MazG family protein
MRRGEVYWADLFPRSGSERVEIMARLRAPGGCPWDREQTFDSIKPYLLEETYEVMDAIDRRDWPNFRGTRRPDAAGGLLFAQMARSRACSAHRDSLDAINEKLIRRHPHVFGEATARNAGRREARWDEIKADREGGRRAGRSAAAGRRAARLPALVEAQQISSRAAHVGFDWENAEQVLEKLHEELGNSPRRAAAGAQETWKTNSATCCSCW